MALLHWPHSLALLWLACAALVAFMLWLEHRAACRAFVAQERDQQAQQHGADALGGLVE